MYKFEFLLVLTYFLGISVAYIFNNINEEWFLEIPESSIRLERVSLLVSLRNLESICKSLSECSTLVVIHIEGIESTSKETEIINNSFNPDFKKKFSFQESIFNSKHLVLTVFKLNVKNNKKISMGSVKLSKKQIFGYIHDYQFNLVIKYSNGQSIQVITKRLQHYSFDLSLRHKRLPDEVLYLFIKYYNKKGNKPRVVYPYTPYPNCTFKIDYEEYIFGQKQKIDVAFYYEENDEKIMFPGIIHIPLDDVLDVNKGITQPVIKF